MTVQYPVVEIFDSVQGEGRYSGVGATFIRLAGCNLHCSWCDTDHALSERSVGLIEAGAIVERHSFRQPLAVITGGEPALYDLGPLVAALHDRSKYVCVETNGTQPIPAAWEVDWITVSPKPESRYVIRCRADEVKYVVDEAFTLEYVDLARYAGRVVLQAESCKAESMAKAYALVMSQPQYKLRVGIQLHKVLGVE